MGAELALGHLLLLVHPVVVLARRRYLLLGGVGVLHGQRAEVSVAQRRGHSSRASRAPFAAVSSAVAAATFAGKVELGQWHGALDDRHTYSCMALLLLKS